MSNDTQPEIRFPGFTGDWEQRKLGDEFEKVNERNDGSFGKDKWISVAKMYFQDPEKVQSNNIDTRTYVMRLGDIAFEGHPNADFKFGRFVVNDIGEGVVSELFPIYRHKQEYDNNYWKYAIQLERIMAPIFAKSITSSGNSSNKLYPKHFLRQRVSVASIDEQHKIGDFLLTIDRTITLHQRKLDLLKETKKGFLQKMFPKNGAKVPEIRFPGFTEDWEERKLRDITERVRGNDGRMDLPTLTISASSGWLDQRDRFSGNIAGKEQKNYTLLKKGQLSYNHGNSKLAKYGVVCELTTYDEALVPRVYHSFDTNELASSNFIEYMFATKRPDRELAKLVSSGARMDGLLNINFDEFMGINVSVPSVEEQQKIGAFFKQLDDTITLHQRKLDLLKETKKGFLQKMFV
ncbi:TPA: restriction endonuclease subunit S [Enterococcus faecium]|nr:restriction endonuclease subunit S [Enterococcus faecium]EGP5135314.1 restriction endonuclease subunit S [Enterococcus faecium]EGP5533507.1 restriction endonuclease subunit S [Enterococcus faecium]EGP5536190.1 restriction endonuclease subunit S [Enterococcus faecium]EMF0434190.1 restriction endonuclease subunit S [Enterococcus faecium]